MNRQTAEKITTEYLKSIFGFALKRCKSIQDAEDLSQEIVAKVFRALIYRDDIVDIPKFVWTVAHNAMSNYYRDSSKNFVGISTDEIADMLSDNFDITYDLELRETVAKLQSEIAYLSKLQRKIVISYYYENKKQNEIANEFGIPVGTVKWHLFEAKKELKRGMETMRNLCELKFNPIEFALCGTNGSVGTKGNNGNFFRSALSQNIEYAIWKAPKTINEIAEVLGVSPVYIESEVEYLEKYGFIIKQGDKYLCNILISESTNELNHLHDVMYEKAAKIFANELYDELVKSDILDNLNIKGGYAVVSPDSNYKKDKNFFLWALIPYIAALSGEHLMDKAISFEQAATIRPDGGHNICYASVLNSETTPPKYFDSMKNWCGPCWNKSGDLTFWQIDSEWSANRVDNTYHLKAEHALSLLQLEMDGEELNQDDFASLSKFGLLKTVCNPQKQSYTAIQCVLLEGSAIKKSLLAIGDKIKEKYIEEFNTLREPYIKAVLKETPSHLHTMQKYGLQYIFYSDGWFILHCLKELVNNGKLKPPTEEQKQALTTIIIRE